MMTHAALLPPAAPAYRIDNARVPADLIAAPELTIAADGLAEVALVVERGRIAHIGPAGETLLHAANLPALDLRQGLVLPRFVDPHTHLDKGHIWGRAPNPDGTFSGARSAAMADREARWSADDVRARMEFALRCALAHGTGAIRTHLDSIGMQAAISWPLFAEVREAWRDRIALQAVALFPTELAVDDPPQFRTLVATVARHGGILGGLTFMGEPVGEKLDRALDLTFAAASAHGLDLDFHVDESASVHARSLDRIAAAALRSNFAGKILAGHCCSLALMEEDERRRVIDLLGQARIGVVSLPMCNMYLQDRVPGRTPRWRGVAPLIELDAAGVPVLIASDNTRDPFYAYGDLDMLEVLREATRILHLDHCQRAWTRLVGAAPADFLGFAEQGRIAAGRAADLVLTRARTLNELNSRPQSDRAVLIAGRAIDTALPDYRELDGLASQ